MDRTSKFKRLLGNRFSLSAVLFLLVITIGAFSALFGAADTAAACAGYARPSLVKGDPSLPHSETAGRPLPSAALNAPAPVDSWSKRVSQKTAAAEAAVQKSLTDQHLLIQLYGGYQALTGRTVVEDVEPDNTVVRLSDGLLTFTASGDPDAAAQAASLKRLQLALGDRDIPLLYLQSPSKIADGSGLPPGVEDTSGRDADALLAALDQAEVDYIDFRQTLRDAGGPWASWFYVTDHHWNQEGAFLAFQALCRKLNDYDQTLSVSRGSKRRPIAIDEKWTDRDSYDIATLPGAFLGSQGKRVGSLYAGMDDFALWTPKFPTLLRYDATQPVSYGDAEETVLFPQRLEESDPFDANPYTYYAGGDYGVARIKNYYNPQGPRILLIRDSFACAITPYLAYASSELLTIDPRSFHSDLLNYIDWTKPDVVLVMYSSGMVRSEEYYRLLAQPSVPSKGDVLRWKTDEP